jgi:hypothetical protein
MTIAEELTSALRTAADAGDLDAARELGRLLSLLPVDPACYDPLTGPVSTWSELDWLRVVVEARPEDLTTANLLAGRLVQQIGYLKESWGDHENAIDALREEAEELYARVLRADPADPTARAGRARVAELFGHETEAEQHEEYTFLLAEYGYQSGGGGGSAYMVVVDPGELRWALDVWLKMNEGIWDEEVGLGGAWFTLTTVDHGTVVNEIDLEEHIADGLLDWDSIIISTPAGPPLPTGHPPLLNGLRHDFGYSEVVA